MRVSADRALAQVDETGYIDATIMDFAPAAHLALHRDFLEAIDQGRSPAVSGEEALLTHRLIDRIIATSAFIPSFSQP